MDPYAVSLILGLAGTFACSGCPCPGYGPGPVAYGYAPPPVYSAPPPYYPPPGPAYPGPVPPIAPPIAPQYSPYSGSHYSGHNFDHRGDRLIQAGQRCVTQCDKYSGTCNTRCYDDGNGGFIGGR